MDHKLNLRPVAERPFNAETPFLALNNIHTPTDLFYVRNHFDIPTIDSDQFNLRIDGAAANPLEITLDQLRDYPERSLTIVMECAGNGRASMRPVINGTPWNLGAISQAKFTGTALHHILESANISTDTKEIRFTGADQGLLRSGNTEHYVRSLPLEIAMHHDTILAWQMNDEPLSSQHGYPLRLVVPGWYGMASVKWLREITALTQPFKGFFQSQEYVYDGEPGIPDQTPVTNMRVRSLIIEPEPESRIRNFEFHLAGIAWTGNGTVKMVELRFDGGDDWVDAEIKSSSSQYGLVRWEHEWRPEQTGNYTIIARATDSTGDVQPLEPRWNKGGYGNNSAHQIKISFV